MIISILNPTLKREYQNVFFFLYVLRLFIIDCFWMTTVHCSNDYLCFNVRGSGLMAFQLLAFWIRNDARSHTKYHHDDELSSVHQSWKGTSHIGTTKTEFQMKREFDIQQQKKNVLTTDKRQTKLIQLWINKCISSKNISEWAHWPWLNWCDNINFLNTWSHYYYWL